MTNPASTLLAFSVRYSRPIISIETGVIKATNYNAFCSILQKTGKWSESGVFGNCKYFRKTGKWNESGTRGNWRNREFNELNCKAGILS